LGCSETINAFNLLLLHPSLPPAGQLVIRVGFAIMSQQIVLPIERSGTPRLYTVMSDNAMRRLKVSRVVSFSVVQTLPFENGITTFFRTMKLDIFLKRNFRRRRIGIRGLINSEY
jgi:hypothetical protein